MGGKEKNIRRNPRTSALLFAIAGTFTAVIGLFVRQQPARMMLLIMAAGYVVSAGIQLLLLKRKTLFKDKTSNPE
ncbi:MAG: hypothetical protein JST42_02415 [Bacteroidetes bacterium]|nr:hypothetical protein [Bacteroidota bacterium]